MYRASPPTVFPAIALLMAGMPGSSVLRAQTTGAILVSVRDENNLPVAGRRLTLQSADRTTSRYLVTDARGEASAAGLLPGVYYIEGKPINLKADERAVVRMNLVPAEATIVIEASPLQTETSSVGVQTTLLPQDLNSLPLPVHRYVEYSYLAPGITPSGRPEPVVLGSMLDSNAFIIDGMPTNLSSTGRFGLNISSEIIESQTLTTGGHKAEIGPTAGGVFSVVTKSGTNDFKGSLLGYSIWRRMNARPFRGLVNAPDERATDSKEWAVTLGGPVIKDRLFFF